MSRRAFKMAFVSPAAEALESELATLSASVASAIQPVTLFRELEPAAVWAAHGVTSYVAWLGWRVGLAPNAAREKIRVARALGQLPGIDAVHPSTSDAGRATAAHFDEIPSTGST